MMYSLANFKHWDVVAICIAMSIVFVLEMMGVFGAKYVTITALVRMYMPKWARAMALGWLVYHFMVQ